MHAHTHPPLLHTHARMHAQTHTHTQLLDSHLLYLATVGVLSFKSYAINAWSDLM